MFLNEKRFRGVGGQDITPEVQFTIAGVACMLLLKKEPSYFPGFSSILVYPDTYETPHVKRVEPISWLKIHPIKRSDPIMHISLGYRRLKRTHS